MDFNGLKDKLLSTLGQTADTVKDFAEKAGDSAKDLADKAADKAKAGGRIAKLTMDVSGERETMKKTFLEIGRLYYDLHKDAPEDIFVQLCEEIALAEKNIADKEAEIAALKNEFTCKAEPDVSVEFEEIVEQEEAAVAEEAPVEDAPVEEAPVEDAPAEDAPVEDAPVEDAPVEDAPVEDAPVEE